MRLAFLFSFFAASACVLSKAVPGSRTNGLSNGGKDARQQVRSRQMSAEKIRLRERALADNKRRKAKAGLGGLFGRLAVDECPA